MRSLIDSLLPAALLGAVLLLSPQPSGAHDAVFPAEKLQAMYPQAESFEQRNLYVSEEQRHRIEAALGGALREEDLKPSVYLAIERQPDGQARRGAVLLFIDAEGEGGIIETGIMMNAKGELTQVAIFENNEPRDILHPDFLGQFAAKKSTDPFRVGGDVSAPAGLERTAQAIASGARRGMLIVHELFRRS